MPVHQTSWVLQDPPPSTLGRACFDGAVGLLRHVYTLMALVLTALLDTLILCYLNLS